MKRFVQVAFRAKFRGRGGLAGLYFYVSLAASLMVLLMSPLVMYLKWTGIEYWDVRSLPWGQLITTSTMAMCKNHNNFLLKKRGVEQKTQSVYFSGDLDRQRGSGASTPSLHVSPYASNHSKRLL